MHTSSALLSILSMCVCVILKMNMCRELFKELFPWFYKHIDAVFSHSRVSLCRRVGVMKITICYCSLFLSSISTKSKKETCLKLFLVILK